MFSPVLPRRISISHETGLCLSSLPWQPHFASRVRLLLKRRNRALLCDGALSSRCSSDVTFSRTSCSTDQIKTRGDGGLSRLHLTPALPADLICFYHTNITLSKFDTTEEVKLLTPMRGNGPRAVFVLFILSQLDILSSYETDQDLSFRITQQTEGGFLHLVVLFKERLWFLCSLISLPNRCLEIILKVFPA